MSEFTFSQRRDAIEKALNPGMDSGDMPMNAWVQDIYDDHCIIHQEGQLYDMPYTMADDGTVTLGEKKACKVTYETLSELKDIEIFEAGTYRGKTYTEADLDTMVKNFDELKNEIKPVAVIGHDEDQDLLKQSGLFSAGWMEKVKRVGKKLVADFKEVPHVLAGLINKGAFKRISSEIYNDYNGKGLALRRVAILGGDIPEVKTLQDIAALYAEAPAKSQTTWVSLNEKTPQTAQGEPSPAPAAKENFDMDIQELAEKVGELTTGMEKMKEDLAARDAEIAELKQKEKDSVTRLSEVERSKKREDIKRFCSDRLKEGRISPAIWGMGLEQFMENLDDNSVVKFGEGKRTRDLTELGFVKALILQIPKNTLVKLGELGSTGFESDAYTGKTAGERLTEATQAIMKANPTMKFSEAFNQAQKENPDLAKEYAQDAAAQ